MTGEKPVGTRICGIPKGLTKKMTLLLPPGKSINDLFLGERVQWLDREGRLRVGVVVEIIYYPTTREMSVFAQLDGATVQTRFAGQMRGDEIWTPREMVESRGKYRIRRKAR